MKLLRCDFCQRDLYDDEKMVYSVLITAAEGFELETATEKAPTFDAGECCLQCARKIKTILGEFRRNLLKAVAE